MPQYNELTEDLGSRLTEVIERIQTFQTDAISTLRERVGSFLPNSFLSEVPTPALLEDLPRPEQIARANFALAEQLLRAQKRYALSILGALQPSEKAEEAVEEAAPEPKPAQSRDHAVA